MFWFSLPPQLPINVNHFLLSLWSDFNNFPHPRFQRWQVSSYMFLLCHVTLTVSSNMCWGFILPFLFICYVWLVSTFCSFLFMYVLLNLCYFVSAHCCPSFIVYMHSFVWWSGPATWIKMTCWGGVLSDGVHRIHRGVIYLKNFGIFFTKQGFSKNIMYIF